MKNSISFSDVLWVIRLRDSSSRNWVTERDQRWWWSSHLWQKTSLTQQKTPDRQVIFYSPTWWKSAGTLLLRSWKLAPLYPIRRVGIIIRPQNLEESFIRQPQSSGYDPLCVSRCQPQLRLSLWLREARVWVGGHWAVTPGRPAASSERSAQVRSSEN